ncbi:MAG: ABC transporter ATP-binding protein [Methanobacteriota archaeon]|nr:MAG: ABC transporter ATP-binding protein [Euryarchaeota archaeon]
MNKAVQCENVFHAYQGKEEYVVLKGVTFSVEEKETVAIVGKSGSGKTTLLKILGTLIIPSGGRVTVLGKVPRKFTVDELLEFRRKNIGFVFQDNNLIDFLNIKQNIELPMKFINLPKNEREKRVEKISEALEIQRHLYSYPSELSGGEIQRAGIGVAIANYPPLILADEPTGNLDFKTSTQVYDYLKTISEEFKSTLIIVSHDVYIENHVDRILDMRDLNKV